MSTTEPQPRAEYVQDGAPGSKRHNWWIWVSAALACAVVGLVIWQANTQSDLDAAQAQVAELQKQIDDGKQAGSEASVAYQDAFADLEQELGTTQSDLAETEQQLEDAQLAADQAEQQAADARQQAEDASNATDKASAEAKEAQAQVKAAESRTAIAKDCANAFVSELSKVAQSEDPTAAATAAKADLQAILGDCKAALGTA